MRAHTHIQSKRNDEKLSPSLSHMCLVTSHTFRSISRKQKQTSASTDINPNKSLGHRDKLIYMTGNHFGRVNKGSKKEWFLQTTTTLPNQPWRRGELMDVLFPFRSDSLEMFASPVIDCCQWLSWKRRKWWKGRRKTLCAGKIWWRLSKSKRGKQPKPKLSSLYPSVRSVRLFVK